MQETRLHKLVTYVDSESKSAVHADIHRGVSESAHRKGRGQSFVSLMLRCWKQTALTAHCDFAECPVTHGQFPCLLLSTAGYTGELFTAKEKSQICSSVQRSPGMEGSVLWWQPSPAHSSKVGTPSLAWFFWTWNLVLMESLSKVRMTAEFQMNPASILQSSLIFSVWIQQFCRYLWGWLEVGCTQKAPLRSSMLDAGVPYVMTSGTTAMQRWFVDNWAWGKRLHWQTSAWMLLTQVLNNEDVFSMVSLCIWCLSFHQAKVEFPLCQSFYLKRCGKGMGQGTFWQGFQPRMAGRGTLHRQRADSGPVSQKFMGGAQLPGLRGCRSVLQPIHRWENTSKKQNNTRSIKKQIKWHFWSLYLLQPHLKMVNRFMTQKTLLLETSFTWWMFAQNRRSW